MTRVLITGSSGYMASDLIPRLKKKPTIKFLANAVSTQFFKIYRCIRIKSIKLHRCYMLSACG